MGIVFSSFASLSASFSNFFMRRSLDIQSSNRFFLLIQLFFSFVIAVVLQPIMNQEFSWSLSGCLFGAFTGLILGLMMASMGKSLEFGPPGLTFAIINAAAISPIFLMVLAFGKDYGFIYKLEHGLGALLVVAGLFWAGVQKGAFKDKKKWLFLVLMAFTFQLLGLTLLEVRALFIKHPDVSSAFYVTQAETQWFSPSLFLTAFFVQLYNVLKYERTAPKNEIMEGVASNAMAQTTAFSIRMPSKAEVLNGVVGGVFNGMTTFFLMLATEYASEAEHAMIFPMFVVLIIIFCNIWGQRLYKEKVNWKATALCALGILVGSISWAELFH